MRRSQSKNYMREGYEDLSDHETEEDPEFNKRPSLMGLEGILDTRSTSRFEQKTTTIIPGGEKAAVSSNISVHKTVTTQN